MPHRFVPRFEVSGCPRCKELNEDLEKLIVKYCATVDHNRGLVATHPNKTIAETIERIARMTMEDARQALVDHRKKAHPQLVGQ